MTRTKWERVDINTGNHRYTDRLPVPGGWLYSVQEGYAADGAMLHMKVVFVPAPPNCVKCGKRAYAGDELLDGWCANCLAPSGASASEFPPPDRSNVCDVCGVCGQPLGDYVHLRCEQEAVALGVPY